MIKRVSIAFLFLFMMNTALSQKSVYLNIIKEATERGWRDSPRVLEQWKKTTRPNILWGYDSPAHPVYLASTLAFLYEETKNMDYAKRAAELLAMYGDLRA